MSLTLSHTSALYVTRMLRSEGVDLRHGMDYQVVAHPSPWRGNTWTTREFLPEFWHWPAPSKDEKLHVLVPSRNERIRMRDVISHACTANLPAQSVLWLDEHASMVAPELLFVQMADVLPLGELVVLGFELCGFFSRLAGDVGGPAVEQITPATTVRDIRSHIDATKRVKGSKRAREALAYVYDGAASVPEAVLATMYSLPSECNGYGMGPLVVNEAIKVNRTEQPSELRHRIPDITFVFAPVGINYDGEESHLDVKGLVTQARIAERRVGQDDAEGELQKLTQKKKAVREKYVDDIRRNRELMARGVVILPMTKEDLYERNGLDNFTRQLLACAKNLYGVDTTEYEQTLDDFTSREARCTLIRSLLL